MRSARTCRGLRRGERGARLCRSRSPSTRARGRTMWSQPVSRPSSRRRHPGWRAYGPAGIRYLGAEGRATGFSQLGRRRRRHVTSVQLAAAAGAEGHRVSHAQRRACALDRAAPRRRLHAEDFTAGRARAFTDNDSRQRGAPAAASGGRSLATDGDPRAITVGGATRPLVGARRWHPSGVRDPTVSSRERLR